MCSPIPTPQTDPGDSDTNENCLSDALTGFNTKVLSDPLVVGMFYVIIYTQKALGSLGAAETSVRVSWVGKSLVRIPVGAEGRLWPLHHDWYIIHTEK